MNEHGFVMVQDTSWEGYDEIPLWVMQGYGTIALEIMEQLEKEEVQPPTHVFLQAGVGSFAAAITASLLNFYSTNPPQFILVEPEQADCYYRSLSNKEGQWEAVMGEMNTIMAGLACGEPNKKAFKLLRQHTRAAFSCDDSVAALGMRIYGNPLRDDPKIISGESGAVTLGLLFELRTNKRNNVICEELNLCKDSRVLVINTEGDTDPEHYKKIVWGGFYPYS